MTTATTTEGAIYIARQPILNNEHDLFGYALLYRTGAANGLLCDEKHAADHLIEHLTSHFDPTALASKKTALLSVSPDVVLDGQHQQLDKQQTVLELVAADSSPDQLLQSVQRLQADGYPAAVRLSDRHASDQRILSSVKYLTFSMKDITLDDLQARLARAEQCRTTLLAKDVMTQVTFEQACKMGARLFQGYYLGKPTMIPHRDVPASETFYLQIIQKLNQPDVSVEELERIIKRDPGLAFKLLKRINSAGYGIRNKITSIQQAITLLGINTLRQWVSSLIVTKLAGRSSAALLCQCITRAFMCEAIACKCNVSRDQQFLYFLTGLFSLLDAVMQCSLEDLLLQITLPDEVVAALQGQDNHTARCLNLVIAHEKGDWTAISKGYFELGIDVGDLSEIFSQTVRIADAIM